MADPSDVVPMPEPPMFSSTLGSDRVVDEDLGPVSLFQEINARRARIENAELLAHLRGL